MNALKEYRLKLGLSQRAFGERYGMPQGVVHRLEHKNKNYTDIGIEPGDVFGRLTVIEKTKLEGKRHSYWECRCACGNTVFASSGSLNARDTLSCGCLAKEVQRSLGKQRGFIQTLVDGTCIELLNNGLQKNNTSGIKGVSFHRRDGKWQAYITFGKNRYSLGYFDSKIAAADARRAAEKKYFEPILNEHGMILKPQEIDQDLLNDDTHRRRPFYDFGKGNDK